MQSWSMALDNLAAGGVIDFDAPSFILGQKPRYVGHPEMEQLPTALPDLLPPGVKLKDIPRKDSFDSSDPIKTPKWKKWLFGGLLAVGVAFFALKKTGYMSKMTNYLKDLYLKYLHKKHPDVIYRYIE